MIKKIPHLCLFFLSLLYLSAAYAKLPYVPIQFPRDEGAHYANTPYNVKNITEWWYFNGKVTTKNGRNFGYYVNYAYFQTELFGVKKIFPLYAVQITDLDNKKVYGGRAYVLPLLWLGTHYLNLNFGNNIQLQNFHGSYVMSGTLKSKQGPTLRLSLQLTPERPALLPGGTGYGDGWDDSTMYYYSQPHLNTVGTFQIDDETFVIDPQQSLSWMNRQWTDMLFNNKVQWHWADAQLDNGIDLDLFQIVDPTLHEPIKRGATIIMPDGSTVFTDKISYIPHPAPAGERYPQVYDLSIPEIDLQLTFTAAVSGQDINGLWEGISDIQGFYQGKKVSGHGYTENTTK